MMWEEKLPQGGHAKSGYIHHLHLTEIKPKPSSLACRADTRSGALEGNLFKGGRRLWLPLRPTQAPMKRIPVLIITAPETFQMNSLDLTLHAPTLPTSSYPPLVTSELASFFPPEIRGLIVPSLWIEPVLEKFIWSHTLFRPSSVVFCFSSSQDTSSGRPFALSWHHRPTPVKS